MYKKISSTWNQVIGRDHTGFRRANAGPRWSDHHQRHIWGTPPKSNEDDDDVNNGDYDNDDDNSDYHYDSGDVYDVNHDESVLASLRSIDNLHLWYWFGNDG